MGLKVVKGKYNFVKEGKLHCLTFLLNNSSAISELTK